MTKSRSIPFDFILDELITLNPTTKPFFGAWGIYVGEKIMLILRQKDKHPEDNGVWISTDYEHHESLQKIFPQMRSIELLADGQPTRWQLLPEDEEDFEESVNKVCELIVKGDPRIGHIPKSRK